MKVISKTQQQLDAKRLSDLVIEGLQEIKGQAIVRLDLREVDGAVSDYFVICTGTSDKHVQALAGSVLKLIKDTTKELPYAREGEVTGEWILLDYVNVVLHVFLKEKREFYQIESLWGDAEFEHFED